MMVLFSSGLHTKTPDLFNLNICSDRLEEVLMTVLDYVIYTWKDRQGLSRVITTGNLWRLVLPFSFGQ